MPVTRLAALRVAAATSLVVVSVTGVIGLSKAPASRADAATPTTRATSVGIAVGCCTPAGVRLTDQVAGIAATKAGWVRLGFDWATAEPTQGRYVWKRDDIVAKFRHTGMKVLGVLAYTPRWAAEPACAASYGSKCPPISARQFARYAAAAAERYDGDGVNDAPGSPRVHAWEIWNEPNLANFWRPTPNPAAYTTLLRRAYSAIHAATHRATVVSAGLSPAGGPFAPIGFLSAMYADGAGGFFDALGFHPYSYPALVTKFARWNAWQQMSTSFPRDGQPSSLRSLMTANGDGAKKIWATEYGAPTGGDTTGDGRSICDGDGLTVVTEDHCVTPTRQTQMLTGAFTQWRSYRWAGPMFWYSYQDLSTGGPSVEQNFGIIRSNGRHKPSYDAFVSAVRAALS